MKIISLALKRPVTISMVLIGFSFLGAISLFHLPLEMMPEAELNTITILLNLRGGMPPREVENKVTGLIEEALVGVAHLREMFSLSKEGQAMLILNFQPGYKMERASLEVRERIAHLKNELPAEAERPVIGRFTYSDMPVFILGVKGGEPLDKVRERVEKKLKNRLLNLEGVANVELAGGEKKRVILEVSHERLVGLGVDMKWVLESLKNDNFNLLAGEITERDRVSYLRTAGQYADLKEMKSSHLTYHGKERLINLAEIGEFKEGILETTSFSRLNGQEVVSIYIQKERSANTLAVTRLIRQELEKIGRDYPGQFNFMVVSDQGRAIEGSLAELRKAILIGMVLAIVILSLFLRDGRAILAIVLVMPISILSTLLAMFFSHLSLNIFTLSALALGAGMLLDNSIVILENIRRYRRHNFSPEEAVINGSRQVGLAISSSTLTNVIVFLPLLFLKTESAIIFRSVGLTISFSLVFSLVIALILVPLIMKGREKQSQRSEVWEKRWRRWETSYEHLLIYLLRRRKAVVLLAFMMMLIFIPFRHLGKDIIPPQDENRLVIHLELPSGAKWSETDKAARQVEACLKEVKEIETVSTQIEGWSGKIFLTLLPARQRRKGLEDIITALRPRLAEIKGAFIYFEEPEGLGKQELAIDIFGQDEGRLKDLAMEIASVLTEIEGLEDVKIRMREGRPEIRIELQPEQIASQGLTSKEVAESLHGYLRGLRATYLHQEGEEIETIVRLRREDCDTITKIKNLNLYGDKNLPVVLKQVTNFSLGLSPCEIWHKDKKRMVSVSARRTSLLSLSKAKEEIEARIKKISLPPDYFYNYSREYYELEGMHKEFIFLLGLTLVLVYMVLASFFESYLKPFIIILMIPLSFSVVAFFQVIRKGNINLGVFMGLVMLAGMVVNAAILYMDRVKVFSARERPGMRIVIRAASERLRPIMLTGLSTILGLIPIAFISRSTSSLWSELARTIIIGLSASIFLSLLVLPVICSLFSLKQRKSV